jgi:hypothetical protein
VNTTAQSYNSFASQKKAKLGLGIEVSPLRKKVDGIEITILPPYWSLLSYLQ